MSKDNQPIKQTTAINRVKQLTPARVALGHVGVSIPTTAQLKFQLDHALAKDAVRLALDFDSLAGIIENKGYQTLQLQSQINSHQAYLQRPDKGRLLSIASKNQLKKTVADEQNPDIAIIIADGLSSKAILNHAAAFLNILIPELQALQLTLSVINLVKFGRVAIGDPIGEILNARMSIVLIGERPGLSSPDSLGIYFTYAPKTGKTDAERNCISNIHKQGLAYPQAVNKLLFLIKQSRYLKYSGVNLKDETPKDAQLEPGAPVSNNFLLMN